jgi:hypothetical protein
MKLILLLLLALINSKRPRTHSHKHFPKHSSLQSHRFKQAPAPAAGATKEAGAGGATKKEGWLSIASP